MTAMPRFPFVYAITLPNVRYGHLMPPEDAFAHADGAFCVADGITRDPSRPKEFAGKSKEEILRNYPNPSGARAAAETFVREFVRVAGRDRARADVVARAFAAGNRKVGALNDAEVPVPDFLARDLFGCVASGAVVRGRMLRWGFITDCGIVVYGRDGKIRFETPDDMAPARALFERSGMDFDRSSHRRTVRRDFRNRPGRADGAPTYGALTGEKEAEAYMRFGRFPLRRGDMIVLHSDGFWHTVRHPGFFRRMDRNDPAEADQAFVPFALRLGKERFPKYGLEGTLIAVRVP